MIATKFQPSEVAKQLSFSEFSRLCALLDTKGPAGPNVWINGELVRTAGKLREKQFNVLKVLRDSRRTLVLIYLGAGFGKTKWCELSA